MSENEYLMPLTEREREAIRLACEWSEKMARDRAATWRNRCKANKPYRDAADQYRALARKLRALEPIGTGGTTEGA